MPDEPLPVVEPGTGTAEAAARNLELDLESGDGTPEKLEASRKLEAFLAFTLQVDRDRFASP